MSDVIYFTLLCSYQNNDLYPSIFPLSFASTYCHLFSKKLVLYELSCLMKVVPGHKSLCTPSRPKLVCYLQIKGRSFLQQLLLIYVSSCLFFLCKSKWFSGSLFRVYSAIEVFTSARSPGHSYRSQNTKTRKAGFQQTKIRLILN